MKLSKKKIRFAAVTGAVFLVLLFFISFSQTETAVVLAADDTTAAGDGDASDDTKAADDGNASDDKKDGADDGGAAQTAGEFQIDCDQLYDGMGCTYSDGYVPEVSGDSVDLVVPVLCSEPLRDHQLRAALSLGEQSDSPFVYRNYEKKIGDENGCYLIRFPLELKSDRTNGSYPVTVSVKGMSETGNAVEGQFVIYVTICDGKDPNAKEPEPEEEPVFQPKLIVESYSCSAEQLKEGEEFTLSVVLKNTGGYGPVKNLTVKAGADAEQFSLLSASDSQYVDEVLAGESSTFTYTYVVKKGTAQGQYEIPLTMDYADQKGNAYSTEGVARINVSQEMKVQFDPLHMPDDLSVADVVNASIQAMNLGRCKIYNVRAVIQADGLQPSGTIFIGDLEAGTTGSGETEVTVAGLTEGESPYGTATGNVICYYEDEAGNEYSEEQTLAVTVQAPFSEKTQQDTDQPGQWWWIIAASAAVFAALAAACMVRLRRRKAGNV